MNSLERLRAVVLEEGEPIATALRAVPVGSGGPGRLAASGPRAAADPGEYELLVEAIYEGYLLHYAESRLLASEDPNLALLAGDRLYALGLERLPRERHLAHSATAFAGDSGGSLGCAQ